MMPRPQTFLSTLNRLCRNTSVRQLSNRCNNKTFLACLPNCNNPLIPKKIYATIPLVRMYSNHKDAKEDDDSAEGKFVTIEDSSKKIPKSLEADFISFEDEQRVIQDVTEELWNPIFEEKQPYEIPDYLLRRGKTGVFDIGELVEILREENGRDVCTIDIPKELDYVDYMVIVTARNPRHMHALATFIRKRFKTKHLKESDIIPRIEGTEKSKDWLALDLGNIALHIMVERKREELDLETLWTVGTQFDDLFNQPDSAIVDLLKSFK